MSSVQTQPVGNLLRNWRKRRHLSQLDLACDADISARHLSFLETGRSKPSREMVLRLSHQLEIPLRERNDLLVAAGYAPVFQERALGDPALQGARNVVDLILAGHEPYPALAVDRTYAKLFDLSGKVAIVTGSGQGIGKCVADGLAAFGAKVIVCDIEADKAEKTARENRGWIYAAEIGIDWCSFVLKS